MKSARARFTLGGMMRSLVGIVAVVGLVCSAGQSYAFTTHNTTLSRSFDKVEDVVGGSIRVTVRFSNLEAASLRGFSYCDHIPRGLSVATESVAVNGTPNTGYIHESGSADDVWDGCITHRWILETPTGFPEGTPVPSGGSVQVVYLLTSAQSGVFEFNEFNWMGYYQSSREAAFGHSEGGERRSITIRATISGRVTVGGSGMNGVVMNGLPGSPVTAGDGTYTARVDHGWSGEVTPTLDGYEFNPPSATYSSVTASGRQDYTAVLKADLIELPDGYSSMNPATWPEVLPGSTYDLYASGADSSQYTWTIDGPVGVAGFEGEVFTFKAPSEGPFAGVYTITVADGTGASSIMKVKVPVTIDPVVRGMREAPDENYVFLVMGASQGTRLEVSLVTTEYTDIANPDEYGAVQGDDVFGLHSTAGFGFSPAYITGPHKAFRFRVEVEDQGDTTLEDAGLDVIYSEIMRLIPEVCEEGGFFVWANAVVEIPAHALVGCHWIDVNDGIPVEVRNQYTENSVVLVEISIEEAAMPFAMPIQVTIPFLRDDIEPGDFAAGLAMIYYAPTVEDLRSGTNVKSVAASDIIFEDHLNGLVTFQISDFSVFGIGGEPSSDEDGGGCFIDTVSASHAPPKCLISLYVLMFVVWERLIMRGRYSGKIGKVSM